MNNQPQSPAHHEYDRKGLLLGLGAYGAWIVFPLYFRLLESVPPLEILINRVVWSLLFMVIVLTWTRRWGGLRAALHNRRTVAIYALAAAVLAANWYIYIWSVNNGHVLEGSLGYYINPLINVLLGVLFLRERLRPGQWAALAVATCGVSYLTWNQGQLPWIALSLALTFGFYGLIKKLSPLPAAEGLTLETAVLIVPALAGLYWFEAGGGATAGGGAMAAGGTGLLLLLTLAGPITAIPLLMFAAAAQRLPLSMLGVLQYIAPTGQFLIAVFVFKEPFPAYEMVGFTIIWIALALFWLEGAIYRRRRQMRLATPPRSEAPAVGD